MIADLVARPLFTWPALHLAVRYLPAHGTARRRAPTMPPSVPQPLRKLLAANRSEIAIRIFRSAHELGIRTVAIYSHEDRFALHRFKADEAYRAGKPGEPIRAYLDIPGIVALSPIQR